MIERDSNMYYPFRHDANAKESMLNSSSSNLPDSTSTGRPFATSFSGQSGSTPVFHHSGMHNLHGSYNMPSMPTALSSRNSGLGGVPSSGVHQPSGNLSSGRFASNNIPVALSQLSHGGLHGHSGMTNRGGLNVVGTHTYSSSMNGVGSVPGGSASGAVGNRGAIAGLGVSPLVANTAPRISSSVGNIAGGNGSGSNLGRTLSSGGGLTAPGLTARINLTSNNGTGNMNVQGPGRPMSGVLQHASPQMISLLGNTYSSSGGTMVPGQPQMVNGQLSNDGSSNDSAPFDMNDFPHLTARQNSSGGPQGQLASLRKQGVGVNSIVQQSQEFSIQNEDFPALPGFKGGNVDFTMDLHQKEQHHENAIAMMQPPHFPMSRSAGFALGGSYVSHRQPQQQQQQGPPGLSTSNAGAAFASGNPPDLLHLHGSDLFPSSHGISASYHSSVVPGLRSSGLNNTATTLGSYDQLVQQYQHHQNQSQFRLQQMSVVGQSARDQGLKSMQGLQTPVDKFGLLGLLGVIKMSEPDLTTLALGIDLTTLGLNLNSRENLYKTFGSPWSDAPAKGDPEYTLPQCYVQPAPRLQQGLFTKFQEETLFYIFYSMPNDEAQLYAANELYHRGWFYHKEHRLWFMRAPNVEPLVKPNIYERGSYLYFDPVTWEKARKDNFVVQYEMLENKPHLPQH